MKTKQYRNLETAGQIILHARKERDLSQKELAEEIGVSRCTIGTWERGMYFPSAEYVKILEEVLNLPKGILAGSIEMTRVDCDLLLDHANRLRKVLNKDFTKFGRTHLTQVIKALERLCVYYDEK